MEEMLKRVNAEMEHSLKTKQHAFVCADPRLNYTVVPKPPQSDLGFLEDADPNGEGIGLCANQVMLPIDKYDFYAPLTDEVKQNTKHEEPLKLSFLQIKEGDIESGIKWYRHYYPKIPDELVEIMARYNFGDLRYATRKSIRNDTKKYVKKNKSKPKLTRGLTINRSPQIITFD